MLSIIIPTMQKDLDVLNASHILDVEMSMGQMIDDVRLATECRLPVSFFGRTGGVIPTPAEVLAEIEKLAGGAE